MKRLGCIAFVVGCGFQSTAGQAPIDGTNPPPPDAALDSGPGPDPTPIDARTCFGTGLVKVCLTSAPTGNVSFAGGSNTVDTGNPASCTMTVPQAGGPELCVIAGATVSVAGSLVATGSRALVLLAADTLTVGGTLDVSSAVSANPRRGAGANTGACDAPKAPDSDTGGAGGAAGGSLATKGGAGGTGDLNNNGLPAGSAKAGSAGSVQGKPTILRGGCRGGDGGDADGVHRGAGGDGGGAVYLIAGGSITITGDVFASGAGGGGSSDGGGGGGGGGLGFVWIDGALTGGTMVSPAPTPH